MTGDGGITPAQTVGPYLSLGLCWDDGPDAAGADVPGSWWLRGVIRDGTGALVPDALVETWQAGPDGRFEHPDVPPGTPGAFRGFGRCPTGDDGGYAIRTCKPGPVPAPGGGMQAPHIAVSVFGRGLLHRVVTRIYFADEPDANAADPVLSALPAERRDTLLARPGDDGYRFDIHLQGTHETVFFTF